MVGDFRPSRESDITLFIVITQVDDNDSRFESPGTMHKKLTFSEFCGDSYDTEVSHKFIEYLKLCFRMCAHLLSVRFDSRITLAKEIRRLYTLNQIPDFTQPILDAGPPVVDPKHTALNTPVPRVSSTPAPPLSTPAPDFTGPIRTPRKFRMRKGPLPARVNKRVLAGTTSTSLADATISRTEEPQVQLPEANVSQDRAPQVNPLQATTLSSDIPQANVTPAEPSMSVIATNPLDITPVPATEVANDSTSNSGSYTSTLPDVFDVGMDDSAPPATGPWMIIDHLTGEVIVDENQSTHPAPDVPTGPSSTGVEVRTTPHSGAAYLVETPPILLSQDEDVRPQWLITAVNTFLRFVPCVGSLGKVIDLYLAQEARLGYPELVCTLILFVTAALTISVRSPSPSISQSTHRDCRIYEMGPEIFSW